MKKHLLLLLSIVAIALQSCNFNYTRIGSWKNDQIDEDVRTQINGLDKKLFKDIMTQNVAGVKQLMSPQMIKATGKKIDTIVAGFGKVFKATDYRVLDDFYTMGTTEGASYTVRSDRNDYNDYEIKYIGLNKSTYASVMVSTGLPVNCMVLAIYGKYDKGWQLNILEMGEYSIMDQTAPEYYNSALNQYSKSNLLDAVDMIVMASDLAHPGGDLFKYMKDYQISNTDSIILQNANTQYHLPLTLDKIKTKPQLFSIGPRFISEIEPKGIYPMFQYLSHIPIADTVALKAENQSVQLAIADLFKGAAKNKPGLIYRACDKLPDGKSIVRYYTFLQHSRYGKSE